MRWSDFAQVQIGIWLCSVSKYLAVLWVSERTIKIILLKIEDKLLQSHKGSIEQVDLETITAAAGVVVTETKRSGHTLNVQWGKWANGLMSGHTYTAEWRTWDFSKDYATALIQGKSVCARDWWREEGKFQNQWNVSLSWKKKAL